METVLIIQEIKSIEMNFLRTGAHALYKVMWLWFW